MRSRLMLSVLLLTAAFCAPALSAAVRETILSLPCEGCEAVFDGLPAKPASAARLAPANEPGQALLLSGTVRLNARVGTGAPVPGVIVYAYQTDRGGVYPRDPRLSGAAARHGGLRGWAVTDAQGRYSFRTIRPGGYPTSDEPQHIHMHVIEPGRCTYYLGDVLFEDDPRLTAARRAQQRLAYGGSGIARPQGDARTGWRVQRDIVLGLNVPNYGRCGR